MTSALFTLLGLLIGFFIGLQVDVMPRKREASIRFGGIEKMQFSEAMLPLRSMLWRQIWQPNIFIPLPGNEVLEEVTDMLGEKDREGFRKALIEFKKSRAVGPTSGDYCEVHYSEDDVAQIRKWADTLLGYL